MYLFFRIFDSFIFSLVNLTFLLYTFRRVNESRASLDYISSKVFEAVEEIKEDIAEELYITDTLTKINSKMANLLQRFTVLEENVIELVRMDHNTESVRIETPANIAEEVKRIFAALKRKEQQRKPLEEGRPRTPKRPKTPTTGLADSLVHETFPIILSEDQPKTCLSTFPPSTKNKPRTSTLPEVTLLSEVKAVSQVKPTHF